MSKQAEKIAALRGRIVALLNEGARSITFGTQDTASPSTELHTFRLRDGELVCDFLHGQNHAAWDWPEGGVPSRPGEEPNVEEATEMLALELEVVK
jgi:hypothetical protein